MRSIILICSSLVCFMQASGQQAKSYIFYTSKTNDGAWNICMVDGDGGNDHAIVKGDMPAASRDGKYLTYIVRKQNKQTGSLYMLDLANHVSKKIFNDDNCCYSQWSPDGRQIAFEYYGHGIAEIYIIDTNGKHLKKLLKGARNPAWSPDGQYIAFAKAKTPSSNDYDLYTINVKSGAIKRLTSTAGKSEKMPAWSPNGKFIAYRSIDPDSSFSTIKILEVQSGKTTVITKCTCDNIDWTSNNDIIYENRGNNKSNAQIAIVDPISKSTHNITNTPKDHYWPVWVEAGR